LRALNAAEVRYLVVDGYAMAFHEHPRFTKDLDVWVEPTRANAARPWEALRSFGAPLRDLRMEDLTDPEAVYQIGVAPNRIDILMGVSGVDFADAWAERSEGRYGGVPFHVIGRAALIRNKRAAGRPQDLLDAQVLEQAHRGLSRRTRAARQEWAPFDRLRACSGRFLVGR
jgi:hypothetical protein